MTKQEAIEELKNYRACSGTQLPEEMEVAIKALEMVAELEKRNMNIETLKNYMKFEDECVQKNFTFKSLLEARGKQIAKKPNLEGDGYDPEGNLVYDTWICPNCEKHYEVDYDNYDYCPNCGQKIDWNNDLTEDTL